jgi:hypothetical protein
MSARNIRTGREISSHGYQAQTAVPSGGQPGPAVDGTKGRFTAVDGTKGRFTAVDGTKGRSTAAFGARAAILAGVLATGCAVVTPAAAHATPTHAAVHTMTAIALGATDGGAATPMDSTCCT